MKKEHTIVRKLLATQKWSEETARLAYRARYKCEYCGLDLLSSPDIYRLWQVDHIVPKSKGGSDAISNKATACMPCNIYFKRKWNPRNNVGPKATRKQLILAVQQYVREKKAETEKELIEVHQIVGYNKKLAP